MMTGLNSLDQAKSTLLDLAIRFGPRLVVAVLILIGGAITGAWVSRALHQSLRRFELEPPVRLLLTRFAHAVVFGLFLILALENLGIQLLPLVAGLGVAGAGIALATQGVLGNAIAGLTIIFSKPYRVHEYIAIAGVEGQVEVISLFSTVLLHADRSRVIVPNRKIVGEILHNYGTVRQSDVRVNLPYQANLAVGLGVIRDVVRANARVLSEPAPMVSIIALGDSAAQIAIKAWVRAESYGVVEGELNLAITAALQASGIAVAYPHREVRLLAADATAGSRPAAS